MNKKDKKVVRIYFGDGDDILKEVERACQTSTEHFIQFDSQQAINGIGTSRVAPKDLLLRYCLRCDVLSTSRDIIILQYHTPFEASRFYRALVPT